MKFLIQKVKNIKIESDLEDVYPNNILLIYIGVGRGDEKKNLEEIVSFLENLQIIDENNKFLRKLKEVKPTLIFISNITLLASFEKGRINFNQALEPKLAKEIYEKLIGIFKKRNYQVFSKEFGSYLEITSTNIGPINFFIEI
ncbi:D-aminoacyl-tRNA deacylase [bacterium HR35]|nr:D-aminoacyl-tRNA deacylase [bacterium HR35]